MPVCCRGTNCVASRWQNWSNKSRQGGVVKTLVVTERCLYYCGSFAVLIASQRPINTMNGAQSWILVPGAISLLICQLNGSGSILLFVDGSEASCVRNALLPPSLMQEDCSVNWVYSSPDKYYPPSVNPAHGVESIDSPSLHRRNVNLFGPPLQANQACRASIGIQRIGQRDQAVAHVRISMQVSRWNPAATIT